MSIILANFGKYAISDCPFIIYVVVAFDSETFSICVTDIFFVVLYKETISVCDIQLHSRLRLAMDKQTGVSRPYW